MREAPVLKHIMMEASKLGARLFRNNRGLFYTLDKSRKVRAGIEANGASDLIGFFPVTVTPEMVGKKVAVFFAVEVKEPKWKKPTEPHEFEQENFIKVVKEHGGIGFFCTDHEKLKKLVDGQLKIV